MSVLDPEPVLDRIDADFESAVERLVAFLRIPSVSTDPEFDGEVDRCARHVGDDLATIGFDVDVVRTDGHPMVLAHHDGPSADAPRILYYGHYDVQPADPVELWESDPFDPAIVEGPHGRRVVARGAVDDKGQVMTFIEAFRAWKRVHGALPCAVTVMLEGEEESGSPSLEPFLASHRDALAADVCVVSDTGMWDIDTPAITTMLRGLCYQEVTLRGPSRDLHSGMYGGAVVNPLNELSRLVGLLHDDRGRVAVDGFYDDVAEVDEAVRAQWESLGFDEAAYLGDVGLRTPTGEAGRSAIERMWSRPTLDVNGIWGGYTGRGAKTVIASEAHAKFSCRLVANQDPATIRDAVQRFLREHAHPDCTLEFVDHGTGSAISVPTDSAWLGAAREALTATWDREALLIGSGGSIPAVEAVRRLLGIDSLLVGFGLDDDRVHSPNEKFELRCLQQGIRAHATMLDRFARVAR